MTTTRTQIAYQPYGKNEDGTWKFLCGMTCYSMERAAEEIAQYRRDAERLPNIFQKYTDYKIMKRTIVTTYGEWEDA